MPEPVKEAVAQDNALTVGAIVAPEPLSWIDVFCVAVPCVATIVTVCEVVTADTVAINAWLVAPEGTVMEVGTVTALPPLARLTTIPPLGAPVVNNTVHVSVPAPVIVVFAHLRPESAAVVDAPLP